MARTVRFEIQVPAVDVTTLGFGKDVEARNIVAALRDECKTLAQFIDTWDVLSGPPQAVKVIVDDVAGIIPSSESTWEVPS